ncbi:MAG TPA: ABC transporter permease [Hyphomonadaceae bacterium]|nr:ABC transporter permease [Hyphomonadaceae bacterium]
MFRNHLSPALARILKAPFTSAANIVTLALGLACFIAAIGIATYWQSADGYHAQASRTYFIGQSNAPAGQPPRDLNTTSTWTLANYLKQDVPQIEHVARAIPTADVAVAAGPNKVLLNQGTVDADFLNIFDFDFVAGNPRTALNSPDGLVLTQDAAQRLFGDAPAMGQRVLLNGAEELTVTGVMRQVRQPSFMGQNTDAVFRFDMLRNWAGNPRTIALDKTEAWLALMPYTFVVLPRPMSVETFNTQLSAVLDRHIPDTLKRVARTRMAALPAGKLATYELDSRRFASNGMKTSAVVALLALAALTLLIACVNYANLATTQALGRSKEVGMRRVLGAGALQVMAQAWLEALVLTGIAAFISLSVLALAAPVVRASMNVDILYFLSSGFGGIALIVALVVVAAFFSGAYPALVLSGVRPAAALRSGRSRSGSLLAARVLVAVQFASASFLLILVAVTQLQRAHLEQTVLAPRQNPVVILNDLSRVGIDYDTLANNLAKQPGIIRVAVTDIAPWSGQFNGVLLARSANPGATGSMVMAKSVGDQYFDAFNLKLLAGREFDPEKDSAIAGLLSRDLTKTPQIVIDRKLSDRLGFATPQAAIGQFAYIPASMTGSAARPAEIIGVTESEPTALESLSESGVAYSYAKRSDFGTQRPIVELDRAEVAAGLASINRVFNQIAPNIPAQINFYDQQFEQKYRQYGRVAQIFILLASTAFVIASVGLIGIAVHVAGKRRHEIAVRKTLGSSVLRVMRLLLVDFSQPVLIGNLLAWPLAWLAANAYLSAFADRIELSPAPFVVSMATTLAIAWAATIGVVLRAAIQRPADVLRQA